MSWRWAGPIVAPLPDTDTQRLDITVRGRVQGVGFRYFVVRVARRMGLSGWVANELDGSVHAIAEGPSHTLDQFASELTEGPPGAFVDGVSAVRMPATGGFADFDVRSAGHRGD
jgi:acylphosphatase